MPSTREILIEARDLIGNPIHWAGPDNHPHNSEWCFCAATAIWKAADPVDRPYSLYTAEAVPAGDALAKVIGVTPPSTSGNRGDWKAIYAWNDHATHTKVLDAFDRTIEAQHA